MTKIEASEVTAGGLPFCLLCTGYHPDKLPTIYDAMRKFTDVSKDAMHQYKIFGRKKKVYANKSCQLCGRTYDKDGEFDQTWELTAERVKMEFDSAGIFGVSEKNVKLVVAQARKSVQTLFLNRMTLLATCGETGNYLPMIKLTFSGQLASIITQAQESRRTRNASVSDVVKKTKRKLE